MLNDNGIKKQSPHQGSSHRASIPGLPHNDSKLIQSSEWQDCGCLPPHLYGEPVRQAWHPTSSTSISVSVMSSFKKPSRPSKVRATVCEWAIAALQFPGKVVAQNTRELPSQMGYIYIYVYWVQTKQFSSQRQALKSEKRATWAVY